LNYSETALLEGTGTTQETNNKESNPAWFDDFLEDYEYETPQKGQVLEGKILRIDEDALLVDVGMKRDAIVPNRDLSNVDDDVLEKLSVGDEILVYVLRPPVGDQDLLVSLNKGIEYENWDQAEAYLEDGTSLDLEVVGHNRGGLLVNFESLRGFLPYSQVPELRRTRDPKRAEEIKRSMIGTQIPVKIIEVNRKRRRLIFSARAAQEERRKQRLEELEEGQIIHGPVVNIVKFGIFVDLDGVDGLVHISKLDWQHIDHPSNLFKLGDEVDVKVIDVDVERERVSLDRKSMLPSPWDTFEKNHQPGETIEGRVTNVLDFGAFVEVADGVEGLVHVSEIGYSSSGNPRDVVKKGETVLVRILDIDTERERISLSMRQVPLERQIAWSLENSEIGGDVSAENEAEAVATLAEAETTDSEEIETVAESKSAAANEAEIIGAAVAEGAALAIDAVETAEAVETAQAEDTSEAVETEKTAEVAESVEAQEVVEAAGPVETAEAIEPVEAEDTAEAVETDKAVEVADPVETPEAGVETQTEAAEIDTATEMETEVEPTAQVEQVEDQVSGQEVQAESPDETEAETTPEAQMQAESSVQAEKIEDEPEAQTETQADVEAGPDGTLEAETEAPVTKE
jgi:small subunit ribosomal protein S1